MSNLDKLEVNHHATELDNVLRRRIMDHIATQQHDSDEEGFYVIDLRAVAAKYHLITTLMPRVHPFYTMKCCPDPRVVELLVKLGCGVDCASRPEIEFALKHGADPDSIVYANTIKQASHLKLAKERGVDLLAVDNEDELLKIAEIYPSSRLLLRIQVDDSKSRSSFGPKFGSPMDEAVDLLKLAKRLDLNMVGVTYHTGVGVLAASAFADAIYRSKTVFDMAKEVGFQLNVLDIGGGFAGDDLGPINIQDAAEVVNEALDQCFPESDGVQVISEPGRYFVSGCAVLALNIIGRKRDRELTTRAKQQKEDNLHIPRYMYFVNDGAHGSFTARHLFKVYNPLPFTIKSEETTSVPCSLWGPTCDGKDFITKEAELPLLNIGDWILFPHMGAYSFATGSAFNGFQLPQVVYVDK